MRMLVPSPVATGRKVRRQPRMRRFHSSSATADDAPRTAATSIAPHLHGPSSGAAAAFSPLRGGERKAGCCCKNASCTLVKAHAGPSPRGDGEKVRQQPRMSAFVLSSATADETAPARSWNVDRTPPPTAPHPVLPLPSPRCAGAEGKAGAFPDRNDAFLRKRQSFSPLRERRNRHAFSGCRLARCGGFRAGDRRQLRSLTPVPAGCW